MSSTTPALQPLTTPFVPPQSCVDQFITTSYIASFYWNNYETTTVTVLVSSAADSEARFATCEPSGWGQGTSLLSFSPAVCPSAWTAYSIGQSQASITASTTYYKAISTAYCCSSGFTLSILDDFTIAGISEVACFQDIASHDAATATSTASPSSVPTTSWGPTTRYENGLRAHNAWHISWESSDVASLTPPPPQLECSTSTLASWVPGATANSTLLGGPCQESASHWRSGDVAGMMFLMVGLPLIFGALLLCLFAGACHRHNKRKAQNVQGPAESGQASVLPAKTESGGIASRSHTAVHMPPH